MAYFGCRTCGNKLLWCMMVLFICGAAALLAAGLYKTIPCTRDIVVCTGNSKINENGVCWQKYWACQNNGIHFILSLVGVGCLLCALLCCCIMCCCRRPGSKNKKDKYQEQDQFIQGTAVDHHVPTTSTGADATSYPDQYAAYSGDPAYTGKPTRDYA